MNFVPVIGSIALWTGAFVGLLKLFDWLLSAKQKERLAFRAAALWVWLDDQRLGRFVSTVRSLRSQRILSLTAHCIVTLIVVSFLGRVFLGWSVPVDIYIGTPRLFIYQVWIDVAAIFLSAALLTFVLHPRLSTWIAGASSLSRFFYRAGSVALVSYAIMRFYIWGLMVMGLPLGKNIWDGSKFLSPASFAPGTVEMYGGKLKVLLISAITAAIGAPLLIETLLLIIILLCSIGWVLLIWCLISIHIVVKFLVLRIAEHKDGPVLGISALLVAIGALLKVFGW